MAGGASRVSRECTRFRSLIEEQRDRSLFFGEIGFLESHRIKCSNCAHLEQAGAMALDMLSAYRLEDIQSATHERRILRKARSQYVRSGLKFWSPAMAGMALGVLVMAAAIQLAGRPNPLQRSQHRGTDAKRLVPAERSFPDLNSINLN